MKACAAIQSSDQILQPLDHAEPKYAWERVADIASELYPLLVEEWRNCFSHIIDTPPDPNWEEYLRRERAGTYKLITARVGGKMVGWAAFSIFRHLHYPIMVALDDSCYVSPEYRGRIGKELRERLTVLKKELKLSKDFTTFPIDSMQEEKFKKVMKRKGWVPVETIYMRGL